MSEVVKLEDLCLPDQIGKYGIPAVAEDFNEEKVRYLRITDIDDFGNLLEDDKKSVSSPEIEKYILKEGDIVFARTGNSTGRTYYHEEKNGKLAFAGFLIKFSLDKSKVDPKYLKYFTISKPYKQWVDNLSNGSTRGNINAKTFAECPIILPSREQQDYLVRVLSSFEEKIQINNQINQELEAMAKTLYEYWFVQFDFPDQNGKPYKSSGGKMVYNPELKREIPEGWGVTTFSSWISDNKTGDWGKETSQGNYTLEVDCIRGADINGLSGNGKTDMPTRFILEKNKNKLLTDFDIVIEISGGSPTQSTGRIVGISENVLNRFDLPLICSNFCKAVSLKEQETFYNFVYEWKNLYDNGVLFSWEGKTSGIKNLLFDSFVTNYHIAQPPIDLMEQFFDYASSVDRKIQLLLKQNQELTQLRDWLLPMLMNGQVKVE